MRRETVFEAWAPAQGTWSLWARPILFAQMPPVWATPPVEEQWRALDVSWAPEAAEQVLVVDLPGEEAVWTGLALAGRGYRPVPVFNACTGEHEIINQQPMIEALRAGAAYLATQPLPDAPPAFLLDFRRMGIGTQVQPGVFDNRSAVFPQDFPSASFLLARGFQRALLIQRGQRESQEDLMHVLRRWQDAGIAIEAKDVATDAAAAPITVARPSWYRFAWQRILTAMGLRRGGAGGFGNLVPKPSHG